MPCQFKNVIYNSNQTLIDSAVFQEVLQGQYQPIK